MKKSPYQILAFNLILSFFIMYAIMFLNVDDFGHVYLSITRAYMSLMMVTSMSVIMVLSMGKMYPDGSKNRLIVGLSVLIFAMSLWFLRKQVFIGDAQYMRAMIPHHSSAVMTSRNANLHDEEVRALSKGIIESQEREIKQMKEKLEQLDQ